MPQQYDAKDEGTHEPDTTDGHWQESVFVHWYDLAAGLGGVHRLGHEPNRDGGKAALQCALLRADGLRYRRSDDELTLEEATTERGFRAGGSQWHVDGEVPRLEVHEPGVDIDIALHDFYPITSFFPSEGSLVDEFAAHHYESSGRAVGTATVDGTTLAVDATFHRDHSWGIRRTATLLTHRWVSGTFGPALSFGSTVWNAADGSFVKVGYVVRDGEITFAEDMDVVTWMEADGFTHRGGVVTWYLPGGEELRLEAHLLDAVAAKLHSAHYVDALCRVEHEGRVGVCDFEISNNARNGSGVPTLVLAANGVEGFSRAETDALNWISGPDTFWTTVNATEAIPGTTTPLTWSFYADATDLALRGTFAEIGSLPRSAVDPARLSAEPDGRFLGIFFGHPAANMNLFRRMADLTPGGSGDALEQQFFGTKRSGVAPIRSKRRYPVVAARMPLAGWRAPQRIRAIHDEVDAWWHGVAAGPEVTVERARALLPESADRYRQVLHWHGVGTMLTQGVFDQLCTVTAAAGRPGHELELVAGVELTETGVLDDLWQASRDRLTVEDVVRRHGCHGRDAGELSVRSWREDPAQAVAAVEHYRALPDARSPRASVAAATARAVAARAGFLAGLGRADRVKARLLLGLVLRFMPLREVGRSALLRALDGGRLAARVLGADLHRRGVLADPDDAFFLTIPELVGPPPADAADLVALRRKQFAEYAGLVLPDGWLGNPEPRPVETGHRSGPLAGVAASAGTVTGPARVVDDPDTADVEPGEILVCHTTDPSWASLMSLAAGLVIDVGGPLSHGAIVARELGVPCVIGTVDGTRTIRTGDTVHVDGTAGVVTIEEFAV